MRFPGDGLTDAEIREAEQSLGVTLPPEYVRFLKEHNGGSPDAKFVSVRVQRGLRWAQGLSLYRLVVSGEGNWTL
jgi:hypothetical protein